MQRYSFFTRSLFFGLLILMVGVFVAFSPLADATKWKVDDSHSSISFAIDHGFVPTTGRFDKFKGNLNFSPENLADSKADFTIDINSVNTQEPKRDKHLKSKDFFNADKYPSMTFVSSKFTKVDDKNYIAHGKLTIREVTKNIELPFKVLGIGQHPAFKNKTVMGIKAKTTIDRTDYEVGTGSWAATAIVGDEVEITIIMELHN
ncbi:YceI family protein [Bernardetia sp. ABR2-2B]|uniref:YceI family protein n=1 Tax=Bernardetia sp. ABR2-2B TaxID=3127472 RepID=UPI0030CD4658